MEIRPETPADIAAIRDVTVAAFGGDVEARLVELIRASEHYLPELSLVAELDGDIVGHILLSRVFLRGDTDRMVLSLAPLSVHPDHQRRGIGGALIAAAVEAAAVGGEDIVVVEGHPTYYPRFGFQRGIDVGFGKPSPLVPDDAWMVLFVDPAARGTTGKVEYPPAFVGAVGP